jgi:microcystin-dependent protein
VGGQANMPKHWHSALNGTNGSDGTLDTGTTGSAHNHPFDKSNTAGSSTTVYMAGATPATNTLTGIFNPSTSGTHSHNVSGHTATEGTGATADENRPPFITVHFMIKA